MSKNNEIKKLALAILTASIAASSSNSIAAEKSKPPETEKCFGVVKKGLNDCAGNDHPCQTQSTKDNDPNEFIYLLKGTCQRLVGGETKK